MHGSLRKLAFFVFLGAFSCPDLFAAASMSADCTPGKRCIIELIPVSNSSVFNDFLAQIDLLNPTDSAQNVTVTFISNGEIGFNPVLNGTWFLGPSVDCTNQLPLAVCVIPCFRACQSKSALVTMAAKSAVHYSVGLAVKINASAVSGALVKIEIDEEQGYIKGYLKLMNLGFSPTVIPLNNGRPF